jgi:hypothetical protein
MAAMSTAEAGRIGSRRRWGPPRRHNIGDLDPERRDRVAAFIEAERRAQDRERRDRAAYFANR